MPDATQPLKKPAGLKPPEMDREEIGHTGPVVVGPTLLELFLCWWCLTALTTPRRRY